MTINIRTFAVICLSLSAFSWASVLGNLPRVLFVVSALVLVYIRGTKSQLPLGYRLFFIIFVFCALNSMLHAPDPLRAFIKSVEFVLLAIFLARINGHINSDHHYYFRAFLYSSFVVMTISVLPYSYLVKGSFVEVSSAVPVINANTVGSISGLMLIYTIHYRKKILQALSLALLLMSASASAIGAFVIALAVAFLLSHSANSNRGRLMLKVVTLVSMGALLFYYVWFNFFDDEMRNLSGRLTMWEHGVNYLLAEVGYFHGIGLGNIAVHLEADISRRVSLHNSYLEIFYALGGVILALVSMFILKALWECARAAYLQQNSFYLKATIFLLIKGGTSSALSYYTFDFIALCFVLMALSENDYKYKSFQMSRRVEAAL